MGSIVVTKKPASKPVTANMPGPVVAKKPMLATIQKKFPDNSETAEQEKVGEPVVHEPNANVIFKMGITKNMGDYNSMRIDVSLSVPCENTPEAIEEAFDFAGTWVDSKVTSLQAELDGIED